MKKASKRIKNVDYLDASHTIRSIKKGEFFKVDGKKTIYIKGDYNRSNGKYEAIKVDDVYTNPRYLKGSTKVDIKFEY